MKILKLVYYCLWTLIGVLVLVGGIFLAVYIAKGGPNQLANSQYNSQQGLPTNDPAYQQIRSCIVGIVGETRADALMAGAAPTTDEQTKIISACAGLIGGGAGTTEAQTATTTTKTPAKTTTPAKK